MVAVILKEDQAKNTFDPLTGVSSIEGGDDASKNIIDSDNTPPTKGGSKAVPSTSSKSSNPSDAG